MNQLIMKQNLSLTVFLVAVLSLLESLPAGAQFFQEHDLFNAEELKPRNFFTYDGHMYFHASDGEVQSGRRLYRTNGAISNISMVTDAEGDELLPGPNLGEFLGEFYFVARNQEITYNVWATDGTQGGTRLLKDIAGLSDPPILGTTTSQMIELNGTLIFDASDGENNHGLELWKSDGTEEGTELLIDINPEEDSNPHGFTKLGDFIYFAADDGTNGFEVWKTDGTAEGTTMVKDINPTGNGAIFRNIVYQDKIYFMGSDNNYGWEFWCTDGTEEGTFEVADIGLNATPFFTIYQDLIYFQARSSSFGFELHRSDGTTEGTEMLADLSEGAGNSWPSDLTLYDGKLFFSANWSSGCELWYTDGTAEGTQPILTDPPMDNPHDFFVVDDELVFSGQGEYPLPKLYRTDGTVGGTYELVPEEEIPGWTVQTFGDQYVFEGRYFFDAHVNGDGDLWSYGATDIVLSSSTFTDELELKIYPNPTKDYLWVGSDEPIQEIRFFSIEGNLIRTQIMNGAKEFSLDLSGFSSSGVYLLELESYSSKATKKIVIEK